MSMVDVPFDRSIVDSVLRELQVEPAKATIRKIAGAVNEIENRTKVNYLRMEFGIPGFEPNPLGPEAEISALRRPQVASKYAPLLGLPLLKKEGSLFLKNFLNMEIPPERIVSTVGAMQGSFLAQAIAAQCTKGKRKILFLDPSFALYRTQTRFLGLDEESVDLYDRVHWLEKVEKICSKGEVCSIIYSSPNNPTWIILTEEEVKALGEICNRHDIILIEDAAYFGMDFRRDYSVPGESPYPTTAIRYAEKYVYLLSSSKIFSYAGQRIALTFISSKLGELQYPLLEERFGYGKFFDAFVWNGVYCTSSGASHSAQHGMAALLSKVNRGEFNFLQAASVYAKRAKVLRQILMSNGFSLVYADDCGEPLADGFFFTFSYPRMSGGELVHELLYYGISTTSLEISSSTRTEGVRACVSLIGEKDLGLFESRIKVFRKDHPIAPGKEELSTSSYNMSSAVIL